jgi:hypothetical protein
MSSPQQHLSPDDMSMIVRVHAAVCEERGLAPKGEEGLRLASQLVHEFQRGVTTEQELIEAFTGRRIMMPTESLGT